MEYVKYAIKQGNNQLGVTEDRNGAVRIATAQAKESGASVMVLAYATDGQPKEVIFNPDGTNDKIWYIDRDEPVQLLPGMTYINRGGGKYRCIRTSDEKAYMVNAKSHWCFKAVNVVQYIDGTIEWAYSHNGRFLKDEEYENLFH